jgi:hypothetical protein
MKQDGPIVNRAKKDEKLKFCSIIVSPVNGSLMSL